MLAGGGFVSEIQPWKLEWTPEKIRRFWDWKAKHPPAQSLYFSKMNGDSILNQVDKHIKLGGTVIDLGAGPGYLTEKLLGRGMRAFAIDTSVESVNTLEHRLGNTPGFMGARVSTVDHIPLPDATADIVFLIETIEHLDDRTLQSILSETWRVVRPGAYVVVTTPNEEDLESSQNLCPNCGCVFHTWQHMRNWSVESLNAVMVEFGFKKIECYATLFSIYPGLLKPFHRMTFTLQRINLPHLFYIGKKDLLPSHQA